MTSPVRLPSAAGTSPRSFSGAVGVPPLESSLITVTRRGEPPTEIPSHSERLVLSSHWEPSLDVVVGALDRRLQPRQDLAVRNELGVVRRVRDDGPAVARFRIHRCQRRSMVRQGRLLRGQRDDRHRGGRRASGSRGTSDRALAANAAGERRRRPTAGAAPAPGRQLPGAAASGCSECSRM